MLVSTNVDDRASLPRSTNALSHTIRWPLLNFSVLLQRKNPPYVQPNHHAKAGQVTAGPAGSSSRRVMQTEQLKPLHNDDLASKALHETARRGTLISFRSIISKTYNIFSRRSWISMTPSTRLQRILETALKEILHVFHVRSESPVFI